MFNKESCRKLKILTNVFQREASAKRNSKIENEMLQ